jgi:hypothetical protein
MVVVGVILLSVGLGRLRTAGAGTDEPKENPLVTLIKEIFKSIRFLFKVLFDTSGKYTAGHKFIAAGFALMLVSGALWIGLAVADVDNGGGETPTTTT